MPVEGSKRENVVEIRLALQDIGVPKDILVTTPGDFACRKETVDTILAAREGKILYDRK